MSVHDRRMPKAPLSEGRNDTMAQRQICFASATSKGGSGKTSLAANLCVRAANEGVQVVGMELDSQGSFERWFELRDASYPLDAKRNPRFWAGTGKPSFDVQTLKRHGAGYIFVDVPPGDMDLLLSGVKASDFVIIPVKASPVDVEAIGPVIEACELAERQYAFVLSMVVPSGYATANKEATAYLNKLRPGRLIEPVFSHSPGYIGCMASGRTGPEYRDKRVANSCSSEIDTIWTELRARAIAAVKVGGR